MESEFENPKRRALLLSRIARGYQIMAEEREVMMEMCNLIAEEQEGMSELLGLAETDVRNLYDASGDDGGQNELLQKMKEISELYSESQQLMQKAIDVCGTQAKSKTSKNMFNQIMHDLMQLSEHKK